MWALSCLKAIQVEDMGVERLSRVFTSQLITFKKKYE
jgi:hypothetical protein